jgi:hypothetical protein
VNNLLSDENIAEIYLYDSEPTNIDVSDKVKKSKVSDFHKNYNKSCIIGIISHDIPLRINTHFIIEKLFDESYGIIDGNSSDIYFRSELSYYDILYDVNNPSKIYKDITDIGKKCAKTVQKSA